MSENKFIAKLKGEPTPKSVVEIQNDRLVAPFKSSPMGHIADRDSSVVVAKGAQNWAVNQGQLVPVADDYIGTESDLTATSRVSGAGLWLNATYTFPATGDETNPVSAIIAPSAKWVLTLCGDSLITQNGSVITLTMLVKIGATHLTTKQFKIRECASQFSQRLAIDFSESEQSVIKAHGGSPLTVQVLCDDEGASATIYSGMTHLTLLQRKIDADLVATDNVLLPEFIENLLEGYIIPADYFSNYEYLQQVEDGGKAMPEFTRNGDDMTFTGWAKPAEEVYSKTEIDDKFTVANAQIDANATAIQKTRDDMNEEDGRLQTQITAHAAAITALQNEQTATGNQIQTIESKIPDGTSDTNPLINKQQLLDEEMDIREDLNESVSELQTQITAQAAAIAGKQDELIAGDNIIISNNVISATGAGGGAGFDIQVVQELPATGQKGIIYLLAKDGTAPDVYDEYVWIETTQTFELIGTTQVDLTDYAKKEELDDYLPLSGGTVNGVVKIQNGQGTGSLWVGADVNNTTLTNNQRHLARIVVPSYSNVARGATLLGWDSSGDSDLPIANRTADVVGFGGSKKITNATSPMGISFCVTKTRESTAAADKVYSLAMDANAANFGVPVSAPDLTVGTEEGTINIGVVAGTATIATNNGLDIAAQTKFDTAPTTDDNTTYANALETSLVRKAQVATAIADAMANVDALPDQTGNTGKFLMTDGAEVSWGEALVNKSTTSNNLLIPSATNSIAAPFVGGIIAFGAGSRKTLTEKGVYFSFGDFGDNLDYIVYKLMGADGTIPADRMSAVAGTTGQVLTKTETGMAWQDATGGGASLPILMAIWSDHIVNDMSWLRADTFSWHSGDVYVAAYNHLVGDLEAPVKHEVNLYNWTDYYTTSATPVRGDLVYDNTYTAVGKVLNLAENRITFDLDNGISGLSATRNDSGDTVGAIAERTETIGDITITYYLAEDGHKICLPDQESNIVSLYNNTGSANYYILDTTNKQFKLPRKQKRTLVRAVKNDDNTWYNLYSDGWIEQGGFLPDTWSGSKTFTFPVEMLGYYTLTTSAGTPNIGGMHGKDYVTARTHTSFTYSSSSVSGNFTTNNFSWRAEGYASPSAYADAGVRLEYYFVGNFEQSAVEQTAGLNAEMFNDLNAHRVIEFQAPTAANGYTWYRKYADGWVEQGGEITTSGVVTLPVEMSDTHYTATQGIKYTTSSAWSIGSIRPVSTTSVSVNKANGDASWWQVSGMSAQ